MNPPCGRCKKTVYATEKLSCLDQAWHKGCFSCDTCGLKLTMKTYKGYSKRPYCETHYPTTKFTAVADTPENRRLKTVTKQTSHVEYQKEHRKNLEQFTAVADTPENARIKKHGELSTALYHKDYKPGQFGQDPSEPRPEAYTTKYQDEPERAPYIPPQATAMIHTPAPAPAPAKAPAPAPVLAQAKASYYVALYDYQAAEDDEVSFNEGDRIIDAEIIDDGWMIATNSGTGQRGLLPSNYVEKA
ncbi:LIM and SH3 domain protein 1 isoform X6 [Oopsacas minuta]|uniref:LIM and SH3 domain protein 1 isoform X6 n=1 Tax=Oopsacas minuta TaxID=111878 RepID=A0AAV7JAU9_9METZ|nr:LIM and SH3 domain protein 1 isoform X6 [Oopsacas minuta]